MSRQLIPPELPQWYVMFLRGGEHSGNNIVSRRFDFCVDGNPNN